MVGVRESRDASGPPRRTHQLQWSVRVSAHQKLYVKQLAQSAIDGLNLAVAPSLRKSRDIFFGVKFLDTLNPKP
jgi:hypothetical protein